MGSIQNKAKQQSVRLLQREAANWLRFPHQSPTIAVRSDDKNTRAATLLLWCVVCLSLRVNRRLQELHQHDKNYSHHYRSSLPQYFEVDCSGCPLSPESKIIFSRPESGNTLSHESVIHNESISYHHYY